MYARYCLQGFHQIHGHTRHMYTVIANPTRSLYIWKSPAKCRTNSHREHSHSYVVLTSPARCITSRLFQRTLTPVSPCMERRADSAYLAASSRFPIRSCNSYSWRDTPTAFSCTCASKTAGRLVSRVGQNHMYTVYTVFFLSGKSPKTRSYTVSIYGSG